MPTSFSSAFRASLGGALVAAIAAGMLSGLGGGAHAVELKLAHFMSPKHPMDRFIMRPWSEEVATLSGGDLRIRIYPGGALGKGPVAQYKRAVDGVADVAFGLPGFTSKLFPRVGVVELPGIAPTSSDATDAMWNAMGELAPEFRRVKLLALWTNERQVLMTRKTPIRSVADMKDLKFRVPSRTQGEAIKALGAVPVFMPINRVYNALNTGVIDGVLTGPSTIVSFKFNEVAKYYTTGWPLGRSPFYLVMNNGTFDKLSDEHKALVERTTGRAMSLRAANFYMRAGNKGLDRVRNSDKHEVIALSGKALEEGVARLMAARAAQVKALDSRGVPASAILKAMGVAGS